MKWNRGHTGHKVIQPSFKTDGLIPDSESQEHYYLSHDGETILMNPQQGYQYQVESKRQTKNGSLWKCYQKSSMRCSATAVVKNGLIFWVNKHCHPPPKMEKVQNSADDPLSFQEVVVKEENVD